MSKKKPKGSNAQIGDEPFDTQVLIRCYSSEKQAWEQAAGEGSTSAWLRKVANQEAQKHRKRKK